MKHYFMVNLKIDVTENRIFWGISSVKLKSEIHSPGNFLLSLNIICRMQERKQPRKVCNICWQVDFSRFGIQVSEMT